MFSFTCRMIVCAERTLEDFYVIVHEMGHIQYYMAYQQQPVIFRVRKREEYSTNSNWKRLQA